MSKHNETGIKGEQIAEIFLLKKGYLTLNTNWRYGKWEIDLVTRHQDTVVFIEVKTRNSYKFGYPEEFVTRKKQQFLKQAAGAYLTLNPCETARFDVISILLFNGIAKEIQHFENAFY
jgi:putative endonuclease